METLRKIQGGPTLLLTNGKGANIPVVTNPFGTSCRMVLALGPRTERLMRHTINAMNTLLHSAPKTPRQERGLMLEAADSYARAELNAHQAGTHFPIVIDVRMKPCGPHELFLREDIARLVDCRRPEYCA